MNQRPFDDKGRFGSDSRIRYGGQDISEVRRFWENYHCENCLSKGHSKTKCGEKEKYIAIKESEYGKLIERIKNYELKEIKDLEEAKAKEKSKRRKVKEKIRAEEEKERIKKETIRRKKELEKEKMRERNYALKEKEMDAKLNRLLAIADPKKVTVGDTTENILTDTETKLVNLVILESRKAMEEVIEEKLKTSSGINTREASKKRSRKNIKRSEEESDDEVQIISEKDGGEDTEKSSDSDEDTEAFLNRILTEAKKLNKGKGKKKFKMLKITKLITNENEKKVKEMFLLASKKMNEEIEGVEDLVKLIVT
jgi:hypothetical protein